MHILLELHCHASSVLCCCKLQVLQAVLADRHNIVPTGHPLVADGCILCRWPCLGLHHIGMHARPLEMRYDRGLAPLFVYMVCMHLKLKVAYLVLWAIMHGNAWLVVRESRHMPLWVANMIGDMIGAYMVWIVLPCKFCPLLLWVAGSAVFSADRQ